MKLKQTVSKQFQNCFQTVLFQFHFNVLTVYASTESFYCVNCA